MNADLLKERFLSQYLTYGKDKFYKALLLVALNKLVLIEKKAFKGITPEIEYLNFYENFLILYRRENDETYLEISTIFRQLAHKIYYIMLKKGFTKFNKKFLNVVSK